jgi:CheY-like chemotaxis protein
MMCILLVEDNEQNRYLTTFLLEAAGFAVAHAPDGPSALARAAEGGHDLILLDVQLPGMDGYTIARELRQNARLEKVPIVAVTSYAMAGDRERILAAGCDGYIEKPINPETFVAEVRAFLPAREEASR